ncbi:hypothetical protein [Pontibacter litorisediminis]|uniref:hypothetical protein n=1 Tax=Pontibacter litorisediminis TaxID=1846260 RepID=UPI0023EAB8C5|nr:hypothetical protein [Pontibacter litorisediminis]
MKRFSELVTESTPQLDIAARAWCDEQVKHLSEASRLEWAQARWAKNDLNHLDGLSLTNYFQKNELDGEHSYSEFLTAVNIACADFYYANGGEMSEEIKRFSQKMGH